jgi:hypothetical protein
MSVNGKDRTMLMERTEWKGQNNVNGNDRTMLMERTEQC